MSEVTRGARPEGAAGSERSDVRLGPLRERLERVLGEVDARQAHRAQATRREMENLETGLRRFDELARHWMEQVVVPRLETVAGLFPNSLGVHSAPGARHVVLPFRFTDDFPADARIEVTLDHDVARGRVRVRVSPSIIPILMDYGRGSEMAFGLENPDDERLSGFLEEALVAFVAAYVKIREPDSVYQRDRLVTDPVCGMRFRRAEAVGSFEHERQAFHFCSAGCRERFVNDPERYARDRRAADPGESHGPHT